MYNDGAETLVIEGPSGGLMLLSSYNWSAALTGAYLSVNGASSGSGGAHYMRIGLKEGFLAAFTQHPEAFPMEPGKGYLIGKIVFSSSQGQEAVVSVYYRELHDVVKIAAGGKSFLMGSPASEPERQDDETQHEVSFTKNFYMSKYPITNAQYVAFLNAAEIVLSSNDEARCDVSYESGGSAQTATNALLLMAHDWGLQWDVANSKWKPAPNKDKHPVINVTWYGAKAYADWAGGSLPTEAQWEYACRAGTTTAYSFGADATNIDDYCWYSSNSESTTHEVRQKLPNAWGLYDMHGNVLEWCSDLYAGNYGSANAADAVTDPTGSAGDSSRVLRGGSWYGNVQFCRSAFRDLNVPDGAFLNIGFRVVFVP